MTVLTMEEKVSALRQLLLTGHQDLISDKSIIASLEAQLPHLRSVLRKVYFDPTVPKEERLMNDELIQQVLLRFARERL